MTAYDFDAREFELIRRAVSTLRIEYERRQRRDGPTPGTRDNIAALRSLRAKLETYAGALFADELAAIDERAQERAISSPPRRRARGRAP